MSGKANGVTNGAVTVERGKWGNFPAKVLKKTIGTKRFKVTATRNGEARAFEFFVYAKDEKAAVQLVKSGTFHDPADKPLDQEKPIASWAQVYTVEADDKPWVSKLHKDVYEPGQRK